MYRLTGKDEFLASRVLTLSSRRGILTGWLVVSVTCSAKAELAEKASGSGSLNRIQVYIPI